MIDDSQTATCEQLRRHSDLKVWLFVIFPSLSVLTTPAVRSFAKSAETGWLAAFIARGATGTISSVILRTELLFSQTIGLMTALGWSFFVFALLTWLLRKFGLASLEPTK